METYEHLERARAAGATIYGISRDGTLHVVGTADLQPEYRCPPERYVALVPWKEGGA